MVWTRISSFRLKIVDGASYTTVITVAAWVGMVHVLYHGRFPHNAILWECVDVMCC